MPSTPFFSSLLPLLFGRAPRSAAEKLRRQFQQFTSVSQLQEAFGSYIPQALLSPCAKGINSRQRLFSTSITFWAFLAQVLSPTCSCRETTRKIQAWFSLRCAKAPKALSSDSDSAYCQARGRLSQATLDAVHNSLVSKLQRNVCEADRWLGRDVYVVDGTNCSMPDTARNQDAYPQPSNQKPGCGFPMMKLAAIFSLASGALLHIARGNLHVSESLLFRQLWAELKAGCIILADRGFCSYFALASLLARKVDCVMRVNATRLVDMRRGKWLGPGDRLVTWTRPKSASRHKSCSRQEFAALPATLTLRQVLFFVRVPGFRTQKVVLVTTLLNPLQYPADALAKLYFRRWTVELHFREIKTILRLDVLRCKSPAMVHKEVSVHLIAYNMVRVFMQEASHIHHVPLCELSFKGTLDTLRHWADVIHAAKDIPRTRKALIAEMLVVIAKDRLPIRPNRVEPRAKKRRWKNYHLLTTHRHEMRVPKHRNRPAPIHPKPALS